MKVIKVEPHGFASNSYILTADGKRAVVIDCAQTHVFSVCERENLVPEYVLLTHGHFDHVGGCGKLFQAGAKICCGEKEAPLIFSDENKGLFGGVYIPEFEIERTFSDGEEVELCGIKFKVIETPGHTAGGVCYLAEDCLFTGDTLFRLGVGRCDLPTGNGKQLINSVKKLFALKGDYKVYCGHDNDTTLGFERENNPYV
ncbi:MAG: MBL fold metallo-hydrolase [Clostridia bacterium]|nr:MBL fold metallo-hydrolase [Clostridia bacterium]